MRLSTKSAGPSPAPAVPLSTPDPEYRSRRVRQLAEAHRRRQVLVAAAPAAAAQLINAIAATDSYWTKTQTWHEAIGKIAPDDTAAKAPPAAEPPIQVRMAKVQNQTTQPTTPSPPPAKRRLGRKPSPAPTPAPATRPIDIHADPAVQAVEDNFEVPQPGRKLRPIGRGRSWATRLAVLVSPLIFIGGLAYSCGVSTGSDRLAAPSAITADEAAAYHLSTFPAAQASAYGATYLTLCLTHPSVSNDQATADRLTALARMTSAGVAVGCGWDGTGAAQQPLSVTWMGTTAPSAGTYSTGAAAQLGYIVVMNDRRTLTIGIPIWTSNIKDQNNFRVVGDLSMLPAAPAQTAPAPVQPALVDPGLADSLSTTVLLPFLQAWAASDPVQLNLILAAGASTAAQQGLEGQLSNPQLDTAQVVVNHGAVGKYRDGDQITAQVTVDWSTATGAGIQTTSYSISLQLTAGKWLVLDITSGPVDSQGGAADNTTYQSTSPPSSSSAPTQ
ncbi:conjugal transfer protein [Nakamurella sp. PAMC28650]|uniref:conjugal transfer protein n=1 Tax=Nakamurella sp. PAMC28650 TaxID=2762325 RepID=UPI00164D0771|nr:conjugal transfer protein [Nakamurella sp. PAMC28650]QNK82863.1 conjugal transfer protein [Nakamurella sp. PAMC28650]